jgi:hypothetical protein
MAWTGEVTNVEKKIENGTPMALVTFRFTDGTRTVDITHRLTNEPPEQWAERTKAAHVKQFEAIDAAAISTGAVADPVEDTSLKQLQADMRKLGYLLTWLQVKKIVSDYPAILTEYPAVGTLLDNAEQGIVNNWSKI